MKSTLLFFVLICCFSFPFINANCLIDPSVTSPTEKDAQMKLLKILDPIIGKRSKMLTDQDGNRYDLVVCEDVSFNQTTPDNQKIILGYNNQTVLSGEDNSWLMLTLKGGDVFDNKSSCNNTQRQAHIMFVCDPLQHEVEIHTVGKIQQDPCYPLFTVRHSVVCHKVSEGLGGGSIFMILMLVTFGTYLITGFFYLRWVKGAKGIEQIPNRAFWFKFGNMLSDGCSAVCRCDQYCVQSDNIIRSPSSSYAGYSPIEEQMVRDLQETDRDSALLPP